MFSKPIIELKYSNTNTYLINGKKYSLSIMLFRLFLLLIRVQSFYPLQSENALVGRCAVAHIAADTFCGRTFSALPAVCQIRLSYQRTGQRQVFYLSLIQHIVHVVDTPVTAHQHDRSDFA